MHDELVWTIHVESLYASLDMHMNAEQLCRLVNRIFLALVDQESQPGVDNELPPSKLALMQQIRRRKDYNTRDMA